LSHFVKIEKPKSPEEEPTVKDSETPIKIVAESFKIKPFGI
jgi:hypothetical protein